MSRLFFTAITFLTLCATAFGVPTAKLTGPATLKVGYTARITTEGSTGKTFQWKIFPEDSKDALTIYPLAPTTPDLPQQYLALFESAKPGMYIITFVATEGDQSDIFQLALVNGDGVIPPGPDPNPVIVVPNVPVPVAYLQNIVLPIKAKMVGQDVKKDSAELANFYNDMADVIERDMIQNKISTTGAIRTLNINAGTLMFEKTGIKGKYVGLGDTIDNALVQVLTLEDVPLSSIKRQDAINIFRALAWQFSQIYNNTK